MEFDPFTRHTPEITPDIDWEAAEKLEKESVREKKKADKAAQIRKLAVSHAIEPSVRRRTRTPELSAERHPEAFQLEPVHSSEKRVPAKRASSSELSAPNSQIEQLSTPELLQVAGTIALEGTTARQLFESNQIDRRGLVSIVGEALRGGNIKAAFKKYELGEEAQRGRKIEMRHDDPATIPHSTAREEPTQRVQSVIDQIQSVDSAPPLQSSEGKPATNEPNLATLSQQKAEATLKQKRILTIILSTLIGIGIGTILAIALFS